MNKRQNKFSVAGYFVVTGVFAFVYTVVSFVAPATSNIYNLSAAQLIWVRISVVAPVIIIWFIATYGAAQFKSYAYSIRQSADGKALNILANGLLSLVMSLIVAGTFNAFRPFAIQAGYRVPFVITGNYLSIVLSLVALLVIYQGSARLKRVVATKRPSSLFVPVIVAVLALVYGWLLINNPYRNSTPDPNRLSSLFLPDPAIAVTIFLPYVLIWTLGLTAAENVKIYYESVRGEIYKSALKNLANGLQGIILFSIAIQYLTNLGSVLVGLNIGGILALVYVLLIILAIAYGLVAKGARRLALIEEAV